MKMISRFNNPNHTDKHWREVRSDDHFAAKLKEEFNEMDLDRDGLLNFSELSDFFKLKVLHFGLKLLAD